MAKWQRSFFQPVLPLGKMDEELQEVKNILHFPEWQQERNGSSRKTRKTHFRSGEGRKSHSLVRVL